MNWTSTTCLDGAGAAGARAPGRRWGRSALALLVLLGASTTSGCRQVRGRKMIQDANEQYRHGHYQEAVALFTQAEQLVPELPVLWLNKGYTCRQLLVPGGHGPESRRAADCALAAFTRLKELRPQDARGDQLYVQTLFDAGDLTALEQLYLQRNQQHPDDPDSIRGLQQVYFKNGRWPAALQWSRKAAALRPQDAEAQYGVGTFIWQVLSSKGGGAEMVAFDPRPKLPAVDEDDAEAPDATRSRGRDRKARAAAPPVPVAPTPPPTAANDITGALRIELADEGMAFLEKALAIRPRYPEAMIYLGLLQRQKSFAYFADPARWQAAVDQAQQWQTRATTVAGAAPGKSP